MGQRGEAVAAAYLRDSGMRVVARNWRCRHGELDLVALDGDALVAVEVKTRTGLGFGHPAEAVTRAKQARLRRLVAELLRTTPELGGARLGGVGAVRVDVVAVLVRPGSPALVQHLRGAA
ncbi:YraN family protein [Angustibacter speluncae]